MNEYLRRSSKASAADTTSGFKSSLQKQWTAVAAYSLVALVSLILAVGICALIFWNIDKLVAFGLVGHLYYIALQPLGLFAAASLFGILRSYARYKGRILGGALEMGGPAVVFFLVPILAYLLLPPQMPFEITVFVHGERGASDVPLKNSGYVVVDLGPDRRKQPIGENGDAFFVGIRATFHGQKVHMWVESDSFESTTNEEYSLARPSLYLVVRRKRGKIFGRVQDSAGAPLANVQIHVVGLTTKTDGTGHFSLIIPGDLMSGQFELEAAAPGYANVWENVVPDAAATITLSPNDRR